MNKLNPLDFHNTGPSNANSTDQKTETTLAALQGRSVKAKESDHSLRTDQFAQAIQDIQKLTLPQTARTNSPSNSRLEKLKDSPNSNTSKSSNSSTPKDSPKDLSPSGSPKISLPKELSSNGSPKGPLLKGRSPNQSPTGSLLSSSHTSESPQVSITKNDSSPTLILRSFHLEKLDGDNLPPPATDPTVQTSSPKRKRLSLSFNQVATILPRQVISPLRSFIQLPKEESDWLNKDDYPDELIMKLSGEKFAKVPAFRFAEMSTETLMKGTSAQFKMLQSDRLEAIMRHHDPKNFTSDFLNSIDLVQLNQVDDRLLVISLCSNQVFNKFSKERQNAFEFQRRTYLTQLKIPRMAYGEIREISPEIINALSPDSLKQINPWYCIYTLNKNWLVLNQETLLLLLNNLEEQQWLSLVPELVVYCTQRDQFAQTVKYGDEHRSRLISRLENRNWIRQSFSKIGDIDSLTHDELLQILKFFVQADFEENREAIMMDTTHFEEASSMFEFDYLRILTDFLLIGNLWCKFLNNQQVDPFVLFDAVDKIDSFSMQDRNFNDLEVKKFQSKFSQNCSIVIGSLYPLFKTDWNQTFRKGDPIDDDIIYRKYDLGKGNRLVLSAAANGIGRDSKSLESAALSNKAFMDTIISYIRTGFVDRHYLLNAMASGMQAAHQSDVVNNAQTRNLGLMAIRQARLVQPWHIIVTSIGDMKLFCYDSHKKSCVDITKGSLKHSKEVGDPVGQLGNQFTVDKYHSSYVNLGNFGLLNFNANDGDLLIILSSGILHQLDPEFQGLSPLQAYRKIFRKSFNDPELLKLGDWDNNEKCQWIKESYINMKASSLVTKAILKKQNIAETFAEYAIKKTKRLREWMESSVLSKNLDANEHLTGKLDDFAVGVILLE